ncbi:hypothetical protein BGX23_002789 [Mortierella sp. AD031]|nr:hypothetical protein BGX23_002789 [Mortierella sp. AD031]KAG0208347.1 hypothetical protein BGX33_006320 [Mortierella sp. NVP41]
MSMMLLLIVAVSAQSPRDYDSFFLGVNETMGDIDSMLDCMDCLTSAGFAHVPVCKDLSINPAISSIPLDKLNESARQCYCGLVSSTEWTKSCIKPQQCNATIVDGFLLGFPNAKTQVCNGSNGQVTAGNVKSGAAAGVDEALLKVSAWVTIAALGALAAFL